MKRTKPLVFVLAFLFLMLCGFTAYAGSASYSSTMPALMGTVTLCSSTKSSSTDWNATNAVGNIPLDYDAVVTWIDRDTNADPDITSWSGSTDHITCYENKTTTVPYNVLPPVGRPVRARGHNGIFSTVSVSVSGTVNFK